MKGRNAAYWVLSRIALTVGIAATFAASGHAQTLRLSVPVPFAFQAGTSAMPAGSYELQLETDRSARIAGPENRGMALLVTTAQSNEAELPPQFIFHRYGREYFLAAIVWGDGRAHELPVSGAEKKIAEAVPVRIVALAANAN